MGGTEKVLLNMLNYFDYSKYEVTLWLLDCTGPLQDELNRNVKVRQYSDASKRIKELLFFYLKRLHFFKLVKAFISKALSKKNIDHFYENMIYDIASLPNLDKTKYDAVIIYQGLYLNLLATAIWRIKSKRKITWIHMYFRHDVSNKKLFSLFYRKMDKVFCVSNDIKKHYDEEYGQINNKSQVFYNLLNYEDIQEKAYEPIQVDETKPILLTVGRLSPEKGTIQIPSIASRLKADGFYFKWFILGDGQDKDKIEELITEYSLQDTVVLLGNVLNPYPYYRKCWLYVQPSLSEGFCTSTLEAKSFGKLVVTTDVSGMREQFTNGIDGIICDISEQSLYETIKYLFENPDYVASIEERIDNEYKKNIVNQMKELYNVLDF